MFRTLIIACFLLGCWWSPGQSQAQPVGSWTDHLPYSQAIQVIESPDKIWCATALSVYSIDKSENSLDRWSKVNGLSETGVRCMASLPGTTLLIIAYQNSNVDLLQDGTIHNISAIKNSSIAGNKSINNIFTRDNLAYLSAGFGIVVIDCTKGEVKDTYIIGSGGSSIPVFQTSYSNNYLFAATSEGLKRCSLTSSNPADYRNWELMSGQQGLPSGQAAQVISLNNQVLALIRDSIFLQNGNSWSYFFSNGKSINNISVSNNRILICQQSAPAAVLSITPAGILERTLQNPVFIRYPRQALQAGNDWWIADSLNGLSRFDGTTYLSYVPNAPYALSKGDLTVSNNSVIATAGEITGNWQATGNRNGFSILSDNSWKNFTTASLPALDSLPDLVVAVRDPVNNDAWLASFGGGLINLKGNSATVYKQGTVFQQSGSYQVAGIAFDSKQQLWVTNFGGSPSLHVRKTDGSWRSFTVPFPLQNNAIGSILVDDYDQLWIQAPLSQGLLVYNPGPSVDNPSDDQWKWMRTGTGNGNLPDNNVSSIVKDKNGLIWVGTRQGIGVISCAQDLFGSNACEAILPVVQQDNFAGYLFRDEQVQCMAVDGANRKWVGTKNGVWLISPDGDKTLERFTESNSPLPDNDVRKIGIDGSTGTVYFATARGIVSWKGTATNGTESNQDVLVFPNPVPPGYSGTIAIRGVVNNAIVRITETDGRLVYETKALGGQAIWNGKNYKGQTIASGVYLVFVSTDDKKEKMVTKIVFIRK